MPTWTSPGEPDVSEETMFGGLVFLIGGKMSVAAGGKGGLIVRVDPEETEVLLAKPAPATVRDARASDAGTVAHRRRGRANQTPARTLRQARRRVSALASFEAVVQLVTLRLPGRMKREPLVSVGLTPLA